MRATLILDDELLAKAQALTGLKGKSALVREAFKALIDRESARHLARLGGRARSANCAAPADKAGMILAWLAKDSALSSSTDTRS
jgi:Arc/MetJ family transcription regulator